MIFYTIGVYNQTEELFFEKLVSNNIDVFCDIRQRRGVRGAKYKFVNSIMLQEKLNELNINYFYVKQLAPTIDIRSVQKTIDETTSESKRNRNKLGDAFIQKYKEIVINNFNFDLFFDELEVNKAKKVVLFCVEENPNACHRSIVSEELRKKGYEIRDL